MSQVALKLSSTWYNSGQWSFRERQLCFPDIVLLFPFCYILLPFKPWKVVVLWDRNYLWPRRQRLHIKESRIERKTDSRTFVTSWSCWTSPELSISRLFSPVKREALIWWNHCFWRASVHAFFSRHLGIL